ncbi:hypothetical protein CJO79_08625 [Ralstonia solanacearum]|nr:hypothetical protein CJO76_08645 [Ralstonia solanacearum]AXV91047.1 hypothetical protein CJO79_08625 [Ralstonia solanacearum]AXW19195.1 hypothetical protein CJO85_08675 [Ralstonia solanacearum]AXW75956.1 hypothetical protein CJO97_08620 [Ralstonia solanacearum]
MPSRQQRVSRAAQLLRRAGRRSVARAGATIRRRAARAIRPAGTALPGGQQLRAVDHRRHAGGAAPAGQRRRCFPRRLHPGQYLWHARQRVRESASELQRQQLPDAAAEWRDVWGTARVALHGDRQRGAGVKRPGRAALPGAGRWRLQRRGQPGVHFAAFHLAGMCPAVPRPLPTHGTMSPLAPLPEHFAQYRDRNRGASIVVCGCGPSLALLEQPERWLTIGVNDVGRAFTPDYLVVVNERHQFARERYAYVEHTQAKAVFTQLAQLALPQTRVVRFRLGRRGGTERAEGDALHYSNNSPYVAVQLARHLGAARIGLIGVDFTDDHFFGATGRHPLAGRLREIDLEYAALVRACRADGVDLWNLSPTSRLTAVPRMSLAAWSAAAMDSPSSPRPAGTDEPRSSTPGYAGRRVFFVHYRFLACGNVFETGLREAATQLGLAHTHADWDDPRLVQKIEHFDPELLFVVHGRRYVQRRDKRLATCRSAVWLVDEPYEVDDTSAWSGQFDHVFVNDPATLARHRHAHVLPVAYAPALHHNDPTAARPRRAGFIGGANPSREAVLAGLARRGLIDHVAGGPWHDARLRQLCLAANVPPERTAALYRETSIVLNVFRDRHHYNRAGLPGLVMNPRIVEALACGALVLSEPRPLLDTEVPELPTFRSEAEAAALLEHFLADPAERLRVQRACAARLADATYLQRLRTVMDIVLDSTSCRAAVGPLPARAPLEPPAAWTPAGAPLDALPPLRDDWTDLGGVTRTRGDGELVIDPGLQRGPGLERGLASRQRHEAVELAFEACLEPGAVLLAKLHQQDQLDQTTNSYHLWVDERRAYLARHSHVFRLLEPPRSAWVGWRLQCGGGILTLWRNDHLIHRVHDGELDGGYAFLGAQGGVVRVRGLSLHAAQCTDGLPPGAQDEADTLQPVQATMPRLSIVTTVYDRIDCLRHCIASVRKLAYRDYEHLIVADHPPPDVMEQIRATVARAGDARIGLYNLKRRNNNWGIAPAAAGLRRARGEFLAFLSDDNGYLPDHFGPLIRTLERDPALGFVYSSCQYDGRLVLSHPVPRPGRIDLGQPLFRRELFELHLHDELPFDMMAWDWHLVDTLMRHGVRWRHVDRPTFLFRLAKYPQFMAA